MKNNKSKPLVIIQCYEDRQQTLPLRKAQYDTTDVATNNHAPLKREATDNPPPPPPMPKTNGESKTVTSQNSITKPFNQDVIRAPHLRNGTLTRTPTPDYNNKTGPVQSKLNGTKDERAELESLESYKLKNPANVLPKPPSTYFMRAPNGTATMKKIARPVSVTIGEYANGGRREPIKLDFLNGDKSEGTNDAGDVPITNRLQSELALTLSRSNLRKKTEALDNGISKRYFSRASNDDSDASIDKNFHARYGNNILPLPPSVTIPKVTKLKTQVI